jgi:hypothetical protein
MPSCWLCLGSARTHRYIKNFVDVGITFGGKKRGLLRSETFQLDRNRMLIVGHKLAGKKANGFVLAIQNNVSTVRLFFQAVRQKHCPKVA